MAPPTGQVCVRLRHLRSRSTSSAMRLTAELTNFSFVQFSFVCRLLFLFISSQLILFRYLSFFFIMLLFCFSLFIHLLNPIYFMPFFFFNSILPFVFFLICFIPCTMTMKSLSQSQLHNSEGTAHSIIRCTFICLLIFCYLFLTKPSSRLTFASKCDVRWRIQEIFD